MKIEYLTPNQNSCFCSKLLDMFLGRLNLIQVWDPDGPVHNGL